MKSRLQHKHNNTYVKDPTKNFHITYIDYLNYVKVDEKTKVIENRDKVIDEILKDVD